MTDGRTGRNDTGTEHRRHTCKETNHGHVDGYGRTQSDIRSRLVARDLAACVRKHALGMFRGTAEAEGKIHGISAEDVHFHEVGALDSIADIVLTCVGIEALGVEKVFVSSLHEGRGTIECAHGTFPLPAPATMELLAGIPLSHIDAPHDLITPPRPTTPPRPGAPLRPRTSGRGGPGPWGLSSAGCSADTSPVSGAAGWSARWTISGLKLGRPLVA